MPILQVSPWHLLGLWKEEVAALPAGDVGFGSRMEKIHSWKLTCLPMTAILIPYRPFMLGWGSVQGYPLPCKGGGGIPCPPRPAPPAPPSLPGSDPAPSPPRSGCAPCGSGPGACLKPGFLVLAVHHLSSALNHIVSTHSVLSCAWHWWAEME